MIYAVTAGDTMPWDKSLWTKLSPLLDQALDLDPDSRAGMLSRLRADAPVVAEALERLLDEHSLMEASAFMANPDGLGAGPSASLAGQSIGAYILERPLGSGGMGSVWLAHRSDGRFEGAVAVKLLHLGALDGVGQQRFRREGTLLARLSHPHIARLLDAGLTPAGQPYLVLEHVEGTRIDRFARERQLDVGDRLRLFLQVADAVAHAHANLVVHRDLKPSNILVDVNGQAKLLDFGIATLLDDGDDEPGTLTRAAGRALTPEYAAPEQVSTGGMTTATDIYSLGVVLYQLLVGRHPTAGKARSEADIVRALFDEEPPRPSDVARRLDADREEEARILDERRTTSSQLARACRGDLDVIVGRALKKEPAERYPTVGAFATDVRRHLDDEPVAAQPDSWRYRAGKFVSRRRLEVGAAAVVALALAAGSGVAVWQARTATAGRDFARRQLARSQAVNELNEFLLSDAAPVGQPFTAGQVLARAERVLERQQSGSVEARILSLVTIGRQYSTQDDDGDARRVLEQAYALSARGVDPAVRAMAACALAGVLATVGTDPRPPGLLREALAALPEAQPFALDRVFCQLQAGIVERFGATPAASIEHVLAAQRTLATADVSSAVLELRVAMDLAESYRAAGRDSEASAQFALALEKLREQGRDDTETAGTLLNNWALALTEQPVKAEPLLRRAIVIASADGSEASVSPMLLTNIAWTLLDLGRIAEGLVAAERAGVAASRAGAGAALYRNQLLRARLHLDAGDLTRAAATLDEFERGAPELVPPGHNAFAVLHELRGLIAAAQGHGEVARSHIERALAMLDPARPDLRLFRWRMISVRAMLALGAGRAAEAVADAEQALALAQEVAGATSPSYTMGRAQLLLGQALAADGRSDRAREALAEAVHHLEGSVGAAHPGSRTARDLLDKAPAR